MFNLTITEYISLAHCNRFSDANLSYCAVLHKHCVVSQLAIFLNSVEYNSHLLSVRHTSCCVYHTVSVHCTISRHNLSIFQSKVCNDCLLALDNLNCLCQRHRHCLVIRRNEAKPCNALKALTCSLWCINRYHCQCSHNNALLFKNKFYFYTSITLICLCSGLSIVNLLLFPFIL